MNENNIILNKCIIDDIVKVVTSRIDPTRIILYGSRANGSADETSDVDLAILGEHIAERDISLIRDALEQEIRIPQKIDLVHFESLTKEGLRKDILKEGVCLYESKKN